MFSQASKWKIVEALLRSPDGLPRDFDGLQELIHSMCPTDTNYKPLASLRTVLCEELTAGQQAQFFDELLPAMASLALSLPTLLPENYIHVLESGTGIICRWSQSEMKLSTVITHRVDLLEEKRWWVVFTWFLSHEGYCIKSADAKSEPLQRIANGFQLKL